MERDEAIAIANGLLKTWIKAAPSKVSNRLLVEAIANAMVSASRVSRHDAVRECVDAVEAVWFSIARKPTREDDDA